MKRTLSTLLAFLLGVTALAGCSAADTADYNMDRAAENFEINRRIVAFNGFTDTYLLQVEGRCNITDETTQLEVICKTGTDEFKRFLVGLSDNTSYFVEQGEPTKVDDFHYRVVLRPASILPDVDFQSSDEGDQ
jgi:hypothetical protein